MIIKTDCTQLLMNFRQSDFSHYGIWPSWCIATIFKTHYGMWNYSVADKRKQAPKEGMTTIYSSHQKTIIYTCILDKILLDKHKTM